MSGSSRQHWTQADKQQLILDAESSKTKNGKIDWDVVAKIYQNKRTKQQLKSQYTNKLKSEDQKIYHKWTQPERLRLMLCIQIYEFDWEAIQNQFFPDLTIDIIRAKYNQMMKKRAINVKILDAIAKGIDITQQFTGSQIKYLRVALQCLNRRGSLTDDQQYTQFFDSALEFAALFKKNYLLNHIEENGYNIEHCISTSERAMKLLNISFEQGIDVDEC